MSFNLSGFNSETDFVIPNEALVDSVPGKALLGIFLSCVIFLSISGNVLVCVAVYTDRNLRKIGNLFVVSLAIADLFVACLVMTFALVNDLMGSWPFGDGYCRVWQSFDVMCSTASILNLCAISLDRYIHIKDPLRYSRWMKKKYVTLGIVGIWVLSALVSSGIHFDTPHSTQNVTLEAMPEMVQLINNSTYSLQQCSLELSRGYAVISSIISFFLPCFIMVGIYSRLYYYAKKHVESIKAQMRPVTLGSLDGDTSRPQKVHAPYHVSESKAAMTLGVIMGTFLLCWTPFFIYNIIVAYKEDDEIDENVVQTFKILTWCGYTNSSFNPIIYSIFNQEFRHAFARILTAHCPYSMKCLCCVCLCCPHRHNRYRSNGRGSTCSRTFLEVPHHRHQNGSASVVLAEYNEIDGGNNATLVTPQIGFDRSRASSGERCLILEQVSAI